ncbi:choice-of-anchor D domain-containing protein [Gelidibacter salicanalis]|uniref:Choice-of-anchor D domain-containing protein n=2 Tax=Pseudomonadati TaxID=3379134 RepID=A0A934KQP1_9FLAO|nr:choice-of-anchor D domain-containing protein [Gelidibacter salicanalis]MBJ7882064.1 choice-of-anchor D domain-containing protein [Gelidibacter salicanalis]
MDEKFNLVLFASLSFVFSTLAQVPEIRVEGNVGTFPEIVSGDTNPQGTDNTLFAAQLIGSSQSKSYRIRNLGNLSLNILNVTVLGVNSGDFTITVIPESIIAPDTYSLLEVQFSPLSAGVRNATVSIENNDTDENPYTFAIRGTGRCIATSTAITPMSGPAGTIVTINGSNYGPSTSATINGIPMAVTLINTKTIELPIPAGAATGNIRIVDGIGCMSMTPFTVIDSSIGGCEGSAVLSDLLISEVTDATAGGLSYIEIYNGTGATVALGNYTLGIYNNGAATATNTLKFNPVNLAHNSTYTIAVGITNAPTSGNTCPQIGGNGQLAQQKNTLVGINKKDNEHDVLRLLKSNNTIVVDEFGVYMDKTWMDATIITGDRGFNFRRSNSASKLPNPNFNLADWNVIDWVGSGATSCNTNDYSNIGVFDFSGGASPTITLQPTPPLSNCNVTTSLLISANEGVQGGLPLAYQWFYNAPKTAGWIEVSPTDPMYFGQQTSNLNILNLENFDGYQFYAQIRENNAKCYQATHVVPLKIIKTTWTGSGWSPTLPNTKTIGIIDGNYSATSKTGSFTTCSLIVNSGYKLHITDGYYVEVTNDVVVRGNTASHYGEIVVESKAALVQRGDDSAAGSFSLRNTGTSHVKKSTALKQKWYDYTFWSSPVHNETVERTLNMAKPSRRFYFEASNYLDIDGNNVDDNGDDWQVATGRMIPGVGYTATSKTTDVPFPRIDTTEFHGEFNTGNIHVPIFTNSFPTDNDWNLVGNPYASAIDFKMVHSANAEVIDGAAYLWSHFSPPLASNPGNQALNFNGADYAIITTGSGSIAGANKIIPLGFIPSGQGFFVKGIKSGGTLTFKNSMRMADATSNSQFFRNDHTEVPNKFWINLTSDNGIFNQILVAYVEGATDGFDGFSYDAERNSSSGIGASIYTEIPTLTKKYAIQGKSPTSLSLEEQLPLAFYTSMTQPTRYALSIAQTQGPFFDQHKIYIKDNLLDLAHDFSTGDYSFTSATGDFRDRFMIYFENHILAVVDAPSQIEDLSIFELNNGHIQFSTGQHLTIKSVEIFDLLGRKLHEFRGSNSTEIYELNQASQAVYIARVVLSNDRIITKRLLKRC